MNPQVTLSVLDLCSILAGESSTESFRHSLALSRHAEALGFERYWIAEHHDMPGIGSSAPEVLIGYIAEGTKRIRVGSGGIMLPNHATYHVAEVFRTLEALYPGRIDLGLGRAPGSGSKATVALRRGDSNAANRFPDEVDDLIKYFKDELPLKVVPHATSPEIWILGSSDFGAQFAAYKGLPYSFAQHFSPMPPIGVINLYREEFRPSEFLREPKVIMGCHVVCAETDEEADLLSLSSDVSMVQVFKKGKGIPLPSVSEALKMGVSAEERAQVRASFPKFVGSPEKLKRDFAPYLKAGINHFMVSAMVFDQEARRKSYSLLRTQVFN